MTAFVTYLASGLYAFLVSKLFCFLQRENISSGHLDVEEFGAYLVATLLCASALFMVVYFLPAAALAAMIGISFTFREELFPR